MARLRQTDRLHFNSSFRCRTVGEFILRFVIYLLIKNGDNKNVNSIYILTGSKQEIFNQKVLKICSRSSCEIFIHNVNWVWNLAVRDRHGLYILNFTHLPMADYLYLLTYGSNILSQIKSSSKQKLHFLKVFQLHNISETSTLNITFLNIDFIRFLFWLISDKYKILFELNYDQLKLRICETSLYSILNDSIADEDPGGTKATEFAALNVEAAKNPLFSIHKSLDLKIGFTDKKLFGKVTNLGSMFEVAPPVLLNKIDIPISDIPSKIMDLFMDSFDVTLINQCENFIQDNLNADFSIKSFHSMIYKCVSQIVTRYVKKQAKGPQKIIDYLNRIEKFFMKVPFHGPDVDRIFSGIEKNGVSIFFKFVESYTYVTHSKMEESDDENTPNNTFQPLRQHFTLNSQIKKELDEVQISSINDARSSLSTLSNSSIFDKNADETMTSHITKKNDTDYSREYESQTQLKKGLNNNRSNNTAGEISRTNMEIPDKSNENSMEKEIVNKKIELFPSKSILEKEILFDIKKIPSEGISRENTLIRLDSNILETPKYRISKTQGINIDKYIPSILESNRNYDDHNNNNIMANGSSEKEKRKHISKQDDTIPKRSKYTENPTDQSLLIQSKVTQGRSAFDNSKKDNIYEDTVKLMGNSLSKNHNKIRTTGNIHRVLQKQTSMQRKSKDFELIFDKYFESLNFLVSNFKLQFAEISNYGMISMEAQLSNFIEERLIDFAKKLDSTFQYDNLTFNEKNTNNYNHAEFIKSISKKTQKNMEDLLLIISNGRSELNQVCEDYEKRLAELRTKYENFCNRIKSFNE